jgi:hypothetical protein
MPSNPKNTVSTVIPAMRYHDADVAIEWLCKPSDSKSTSSYRARTEQSRMLSSPLVAAMIMLGSAREDEFGQGVKPPRETGGIGTQSASRRYYSQGSPLTPATQSANGPQIGVERKEALAAIGWGFYPSATD